MIQQNNYADRDDSLPLDEENKMSSPSVSEVKANAHIRHFIPTENGNNKKK
ncbi:hypothetical protein NPIL_41671, partial [Nephila pilipes]